MINLPTKFEISSFTRYGDMKTVKNAQIGVVRCHPKSSAMSQFDRAHMISYSSLIETMHLSCTVFEIRQVICQNKPTSTYLTCIWCPHWGDPAGVVQSWSVTALPRSWLPCRIFGQRFGLLLGLRLGLWWWLWLERWGNWNLKGTRKKCRMHLIHPIQFCCITNPKFFNLIPHPNNKRHLKCTD